MSVTILCPNGRRQTIKVNPNTSLLEILENVCEKQKYDSNEYELTRNNKALDLSLTIRFANIPNNGQLDLRKSSVPRKDQKVTIAITLEDGIRQINDFDSNQNLWQIIHVLFENNQILSLDQNNEFCVIYVGKEISGENQLKETNLKSLGLSCGRAAMKLVVRPRNVVKEQAFVESLNLRKSSNESEAKNPRPEKNESTSNQKQTKEESKAPAVSSTVVNVESGPTAQTKPTVLSVPFEKKELTGHSNQTIEHNLNSMTGKPSEESQQMEVESEESSEEEEEILVFLGGNHSEVLFKSNDLKKITKITDFPDEFYETTKEDVLHVLKDLRQQQVANSEKPLETKQMKEQKRRERMKKYKSTVIRVCLPNDKLVFQAIFKPTETVRDVMQVLSRYITVTDFHLYTVPPKRQLNPESTLYESELVPAAIIHFGNKSSVPQNVIKEEFKSKISSVKSVAKIATDARNEGNQSRQQNVDSSGHSSSHSSVTTSTQPPVQNVGSNRSTNNANSGQKETKIPKWFKPNK